MPTPFTTPITAAGIGSSSAFVPLPKLPPLFWPQHSTPPSVRSAQLCTLPVATSRTFEPSPVGVTGVVAFVVLLFPSSL